MVELMQPWHDIGAQITTETQQSFVVKEKQTIGGGCINQAYVISDGRKHFFVKLNDVSAAAMFEAEIAGLMEIDRSKTIKVPQPVCSGHNEQTAWLVLEYVDFSNSHSRKVDALGVQLAAMHHVTKEQFGWFRDNVIGKTPQINRYSLNWVEFWRTQRLQFQLDLAAQQGYAGKLQNLGEQLLDELDKLFSGYEPLPSLLHGDLWGGNYASDASGNPVLFDPAVYYGDREADIAMTELFGGFPGDFYSAYRCNYPLDSGYNTRKVVYNLYHILNHLNLFGSSYRHQAEQMMSWLLAEIR